MPIRPQKHTLYTVMMTLIFVFIILPIVTILFRLNAISYGLNSCQPESYASYCAYNPVPPILGIAIILGFIFFLVVQNKRFRVQHHINNAQLRPVQVKKTRLSLVFILSAIIVFTLPFLLSVLGTSFATIFNVLIILTAVGLAVVGSVFYAKGQ